MCVDTAREPPFNHCLKTTTKNVASAALVRLLQDAATPGIAVNLAPVLAKVIDGANPSEYVAEAALPTLVARTDALRGPILKLLAFVALSQDTATCLGGQQCTPYVCIAERTQQALPGKHHWQCQHCFVSCRSPQCLKAEIMRLILSKTLRLMPVGVFPFLWPLLHRGFWSV